MAHEKLVNIGLPWIALDQCVPCKTWHCQIWPPRPDSYSSVEIGTWLNLYISTQSQHFSRWALGNYDLEIQASRLWVTGWLWGGGVSLSKVLGCRTLETEFMAFCILNKHYTKPSFKTVQAGHALIYNQDRLWTETCLSLLSKSGYRPPPQA